MASDKVDRRFGHVLADNWQATVEISSKYAGKITKIYYNVSDIAKVGSVLVDIDTVESSNGLLTLIYFTHFHQLLWTARPPLPPRQRIPPKLLPTQPPLSG